MTALAPYQTTLFAQGSPCISDAAVTRRYWLDDVSWVDVAESWCRGADALLVTLAETLRWRCGRRPMYGELRDDPRLSAAIELDGDCPPEIAAMATQLDERYHEGIDSVWVNFYRDGRDSVAWHADRVGRTQVDPLVALVSLGGPRRFCMRPLGGGAASAFELGSGDLLVMGGACQHRWEHCVPKVRAAPPRMSVTFRRRRGLDDPAEDWWYEAVGDASDGRGA